MMITVDCIDVLEMTDVVAIVVAATTDALTFGAGSRVNLKVEKKPPTVRYNSPTFAILPSPTKQCNKSRVSGLKYQQDREKEERVPGGHEQFFEGERLLSIAAGAFDRSQQELPLQINR